VPVLQAEDLVSVMPMKNCRDIIGPTRREIIVSYYYYFAFLVFSCYFVFYFEIEAKVCLISLNKEIKNKKQTHKGSLKMKAYSRGIIQLKHFAPLTPNS
jgi:hypothetical protein